MDWTRDGADWPNREASRFLDVAPHRWHVQVAGDGPTLLLLHGAGGATHSWRDVLPLLARDWTVVAPDLPGHGFTRAGTRTRSGLRPMAEDVARLMQAGGWRADAIVGHSAGAAVGFALSLDDPVPVVAINPALKPFAGPAEWLFPALAKVLALNPFVPGVFARLAGSERRARDLIRGTGSTLDDRGIALYARAIGDRAHVDGALAMMASWDVGPVTRALPELDAPALFVVGEGDRAVPPQQSADAAAGMRDARVVRLPGGHLVHEERPEAVVAEIARFLSDRAGG